MAPLSNRAIQTPSSPIRKLTPLADLAKAKGLEVFHLNIGQPDLPTPDSILKTYRHFSETTLSYAPSNGRKELLCAWQKFYQNKNYQFSENEIIVTTGGSEGLFFAFLAVCDPQDEILTFEPFYPNYAMMAQMAGIKLKTVTTDAKDGFHIPNPQKIAQKINKNTKAMLICNPNNPTGTLYRLEEIKMLTEIALKFNLFIISDETYQEIVFDKQKVWPFFAFKKLWPKLIIVDSVSKRFNACGARIGCIASKNLDLMRAVLKFAQARLSVASIDQLAFVEILENHRRYVQEIRKIYEKRRNAVIEGLRKIPQVSFVKPEGAFYIMPKIPVDDSEKFARYLLEDFSFRNQTVMIAPGSGFYQTKGLGKNEIRIAYVLNEGKLAKAIYLLAMAIKKYQKI